jgi:hypothetical protein
LGVISPLRTDHYTLVLSHAVTAAGVTNPGTLPEHVPLGIKYNAVADRRSCEVMKLFLAEVLA